MFRFLMLNLITKTLFTSFTYEYPIADAFSNDCLEVTNFPWILLYILLTRFVTIADVSTFFCMSVSKIILNWRPDIYVKLNTNFTVNLATLFVILYILIDLLIRIDMTIYKDCRDDLAMKLYQVELKRTLCISEMYNTTIDVTLQPKNITHCEVFEKANNLYKIGCKNCPSNPSLRILFVAVVVSELFKFCFGFNRIVKKAKKFQKQNKKKVTQQLPASINSGTTESKSKTTNKTTRMNPEDATKNILSVNKLDPQTIEPILLHSKVKPIGKEPKEKNLNSEKYQGDMKNRVSLVEVEVDVHQHKPTFVSTSKPDIKKAGLSKMKKKYPLKKTDTILTNTDNTSALNFEVEIQEGVKENILISVNPGVETKNKSAILKETQQVNNVASTGIVDNIEKIEAVENKVQASKEEIESRYDHFIKILKIFIMPL